MSLTVRLRFLAIWALGMSLVSAAGAAAQTKPAAEKQYEQLIFSVRGPDLFRAHCAACPPSSRLEPFHRPAYQHVATPEDPILMATPMPGRGRLRFRRARTLIETLLL